ncbi:MAG: tol-pal system protein YbgF [Gemmatimonadaceae bacterium]|nr:tol-pal system protein YbgF [Gemmatimonadaceae bacterium]
MRHAAPVCVDARTVARGRRVRRMIPFVALLATGGCFATRSDVRIVQSDVASLRTELLRRDTEQRDALLQASRLIATANDSLGRISARTVSIQGDVRGELRNIKEQLLQVQALLGQSQANLNRFRAELEARNNAAAATPPVTTPVVPVGTSVPPTSVPPSTGVVPPVVDTTPRGPGPAQLYQDGTDQMKRGSPSTARMLFQELLSKYPDSEQAPDAQYFIAESLNKEKNLAGADAAYGAVVTKYPASPRASTALYKRAQIALQQGNTPEARKMLTDVVSRYPKSLEADLAAEQLKLLR